MPGIKVMVAELHFSISCPIEQTNYVHGRAKVNRMGEMVKFVFMVTFRLRWHIDMTQSLAIDKPRIMAYDCCCGTASTVIMASMWHHVHGFPIIKKNYIQLTSHKRCDLVWKQHHINRFWGRSKMIPHLMRFYRSSVDGMTFNGIVYVSTFTGVPCPLLLKRYWRSTNLPFRRMTFAGREHRPHGTTCTPRDSEQDSQELPTPKFTYTRICMWNEYACSCIWMRLQSCYTQALG